MKAYSVALLAALAACNAAWADPAPVSKEGRSLPFAPPPPPLADVPLVCPADVRQCSDGSFVSRAPALDCAFSSCPGERKQ